MESVSKSVRVEGALVGERALDVVRRAFPVISSREVFKKCRSGGIRLSSGPCDPLAALGAGEVVTVVFERPAERAKKPVSVENLRVETPFGPFLVVREDEDLLAVSKPAGCASHPALRRSGDTLIERVRGYLGVSDGDEFSPALANRLDIETSGLAFVGKNFEARRRLGFDIQKRRVTKRYLTLVRGVPPASGEIELPLERRPDSRDVAVYPEGHPRLSPLLQEARTRFLVLGSVSGPVGAALLEVELFTGRTHQIRRHLAAIGHPVAFDRLYGDAAWNLALAERSGLDRMFLHAHFASLPQPITRHIIDVNAPLPDGLRGVLCALGIGEP